MNLLLGKKKIIELMFSFCFTAIWGKIYSFLIILRFVNTSLEFQERSFQFFICFLFVLDECVMRSKKEVKPLLWMLTCFEIISVRYIIILTWSSAKKSIWENILWMTFDDVKILACKLVIYLVCSRGQSSSSALMILCSSLLGEIHEVCFGLDYKA